MADVSWGPQLDLGAAITESQRLMDHGDPARARDLLEAESVLAPPEELELWQGLWQLADGMERALRGESLVAAARLRRGRDLVGSYEDRPPHALDITGLLAWSTHVIDELGVTTRDPDWVPPVPRLRMP
ncbi:DUF309 domain-containing protein [Rhodococcus maanshanensis]|jgi:uncharacterized protein|uniref:DUF309 domain-containing protein n=1 Tax=Rhodococcus maanshanensis TaxID=183556 RepID=UPI0022B308D1|nr:DUF309 domain-containing protein [Rhodococcus maanshanensis]MCZ4558920.1 DUF309 domain-containing protein [Rhodococcus maanshanensis]